MSQTQASSTGFSKAYRPRLKVLFVVEGYTDIRFVAGLSEICSLTVVVPSRQYRESGLDQRILRSGAIVQVDELPGGRLRYQAECFRYLCQNVRKHDVILSQEVLRGSLNSCVVGALRKKPVVTYMCIPPVQYYRCRRERGQCGWAKAIIGEAVIRGLARVNGKLATCCVALGPYLMDIASGYFRQTVPGCYYGVDTDFFRPAQPAEKLWLRRALGLPENRFVILLASRISHEKDPETVLRATALARARGLNAMVLNLGGGYRDFLDLTGKLGLSGSERWALGRPPAHPMTELADYYRTADVVAQASLDEGAGLTPLEALACGIPVVCTAVGGMSRILPGYARLVAKRDAEAMAKEFLWVAAHPEEAARQALKGRDYVLREWDRSKAFAELQRVLKAVVQPEMRCFARGSH
jgi:glycosyltransferase involved in cell wall biosynthesis